MSDISQLKNSVNLKTLHLVLLSIATVGIYNIVWMFRTTATMERIISKPIASQTFLIWVTVCIGWSSVFSASDSDIAVAVIGFVVSIALLVLYVVWAFKAKKALQEYVLTEHKLELKMNVFYTVIFNIYYINYCINDLAEVQRKQNILSGETLANEG